MGRCQLSASMHYRPKPPGLIICTSVTAVQSNPRPCCGGKNGGQVVCARVCMVQCCPVGSGAVLPLGMGQQELPKRAALQAGTFNGDTEPRNNR